MIEVKNMTGTPDGVPVAFVLFNAYDMLQMKSMEGLI